MDEEWTEFDYVTTLWLARRLGNAFAAEVRIQDERAAQELAFWDIVRRIEE